jgi:hypothetical protein
MVLKIWKNKKPPADVPAVDAKKLPFFYQTGIAFVYRRRSGRAGVGQRYSIPFSLLIICCKLNPPAVNCFWFISKSR